MLFANEKNIFSNLTTHAQRLASALQIHTANYMDVLKWPEVFPLGEPCKYRNDTVSENTQTQKTNT